MMDYNDIATIIPSRYSLLRDSKLIEIITSNPISSKKKKKKKNQYCVHTPDRTHSAGTTDDDK